MAKGDDCLSIHELQLWTILQDVLFRFQTLVLFRWDRMHVPQMRDEVITFFVPEDAPQRFEIVQFLEHEIAPFARQRQEDWPGSKVSVQVLDFRGLDPYMPRDLSEKFVQNAVAHFQKTMERFKRDKKLWPECRDCGKIFEHDCKPKSDTQERRDSGHQA